MRPDFYNFSLNPVVKELISLGEMEGHYAGIPTMAFGGAWCYAYCLELACKDKIFTNHIVILMYFYEKSFVKSLTLFLTSKKSLSFLIIVTYICYKAVDVSLIHAKVFGKLLTGVEMIHI